jgi:hypothetical protein
MLVFRSGASTSGAKRVGLEKIKRKKSIWRQAGALSEICDLLKPFFPLKAFSTSFRMNWELATRAVSSD